MKHFIRARDRNNNKILYVLRFDLKTVFNQNTKRFVFQNAIHALHICVLLVKTIA